MKNILILMGIILFSITSCQKSDPPIVQPDPNILPPKTIEGNYKDIGTNGCNAGSSIILSNSTYYIKGLDYVSCNDYVKFELLQNRITIDFDYINSNTNVVHHILGTGLFVGDTVYISCTNTGFAYNARFDHKYYRL